jgi:subtilisin family serine protease
MKRKYVVRGKEVEIEEIEGILAVKPKISTNVSEDLHTFGKSEKPNAIEMGDTEHSAFEKAGWIFVRPADNVKRAVDTGTVPEGAKEVNRIFRNKTGRIFLGTNLLSVRLQSNFNADEAESIINEQGLEIIRKLKLAPNLYEVKVKPGKDFLQTSWELSKNGSFIYAEPQFVEHIPSRFTPTDPNFGQQWHLSNNGQNGGTAGADIAAELAWETTRGAGVRVSVVDNGFDVNHPDIAAAITTSSGFFQDNGMGNIVFVQGLGGYPDGNHGTFCGGMVIARANNGQGGCGVANQADFTAVACLNDQVGTQVTLARAIAYAADPTQEVPGANPNDGADVISCSLGPNGAEWDMMQVLQDGIDFAITNGRGGLGTPIFWAVTNGNFALSFDEVCSYSNTIHVGRSTRNDLEDDSGFGPELDFLASGVDVHSTRSGGGYGNSTGTSFAAPTATGVGALVLAVNPNLTWQQVRQTIRDTCEKTGGVVYDANGHNNDYGFGRVNAAAAVCSAAHAVSVDKIVVTIQTGNKSGASTNGKVYLGIGGREFRLNKSGNQFQQNKEDEFIIGVGSNVLKPEKNELPQNSSFSNDSPKIPFSTIGIYPMYIRFEPSGNSDKWNVDRVHVNVKSNTGLPPAGLDFHADILNGLNDDNVWLSEDSGLFIGLKSKGCP